MFAIFTYLQTNIQQLLMVDMNFARVWNRNLNMVHLIINIANKLTGKKGVLFTAAYVSAFEKMHEQLSTQNSLQHFPAKSTSAGEVSSLIKNVRIVMERQESHPRKIAKQTELLLVHFGIPVIDEFVEPAPWEQMELE